MNSLKLEFSPELLGKRIARLDYRNVQGVKTMKILLPQSGIIRFHAPSEVGKSSLLKLFMCLVLPVYRDSESINSLVSLSSPTADFGIELYDKTNIVLHLDKTNKNNCYYLLRLPGEQIKKFSYSYVPNEIVEALGWLTTDVVQGSPFCLNLLLDKNLFPMDYPPRVVSDILNITLEDADLEETIKITSDSIKLGNQHLTSFEQELAIYKTQSNKDYEDVDKLKTLRDNLTILKDIHDKLSNIQCNLSTIYELKRNLPDIIQVDTQLPKFIAEYDKLQQLSSSCNRLRDLTFNLEEIPPEPPVKDLESKINLWRDTCRLYIYCGVSIPQKTEKYENTAYPFEDVHLVNNCVKSHSELKDLIVNLTNLNKLTQNLDEVIELPNIKLQSLIDTSNTLSELTQHLLLLSKTKEIQENTSKELDNLYSELSKHICPTCHQIITGGGITHEH